MHDGREQVTGFHMPGDVMGMDAIDGERYPTNAIALEDGEVCVISYAAFRDAVGDRPAMPRHLQRILSREIQRERGVILLLGTLHAELRLAAFLVSMAQRFAARGFSGREFRLSMTREDIGSFLGMRLETISRMFSKLQDQHLIAIDHRHLRITDAEGRRRLGGGLVH